MSELKKSSIEDVLLMDAMTLMSIPSANQCRTELASAPEMAATLCHSAL